MGIVSDLGFPSPSRVRSDDGEVSGSREDAGISDLGEWSEVAPIQSFPQLTEKVFHRWPLSRERLMDPNDPETFVSDERPFRSVGRLRSTQTLSPAWSQTMAIELSGNWRKGFAYDIHSLDSVYLGTDEAGHDRWETTRSEMGELVYRLKYRGDRTVLPKIVALLERIKGVQNFDYIVPVPPTDASRRHQPVAEIAIALGRRHGVEVLPTLLKKVDGGRQLKNVDDPDERRQLLRESMKMAQTHDVSGAKILLVDDLFRSGATLSAATDLLLREGRAADVCVLTMSYQRSKR